MEVDGGITREIEGRRRVETLKHGAAQVERSRFRGVVKVDGNFACSEIDCFALKQGAGGNGGIARGIKRDRGSAECDTRADRISRHRCAV